MDRAESTEVVTGGESCGEADDKETKRGKKGTEQRKKEGGRKGDIDNS